MDLHLKIKKDEMEKKIAGEIVISEDPGSIMKKWRNLFKISQKELANAIGVAPSVISDYESNRRKSPGAKIIKKIVEALVSIELSKSGKIAEEIFPSTGSAISAILDIMEFVEPVTVKNFCKAIKCEFVNKTGLERNVYGYTVVDSLTAIINLPPSELVKLYGSTTERAMIFTKVTTGRSPLVAIKVTTPKPALIILHGQELKRIDEIAIEIAKAENIPLAISREETVEKIIENLRKNFV